jgi:Uma2 family endonuclease
MTVEEFLAVPETEPGHWELVDGEVVVNFPTLTHQRTVLRLGVAFTIWSRAAPGRGEATLEIDTVAGPDSVLGPDLQWYAHDRDLPDPNTRPFPLGDLVIEVRSPSTWAVDVGRKRAIYEREGVRELWLVDPLSRTVLVFARSTAAATEFDDARDLGPADTLGSPLLPDFTLAVADLFA